ncbi:thiamine-phosphate kinase [Rubrivirga sp. S365]|uniref:Thiamine-monophosphate kinase n=1 Tax=Rubrivirga litoralis TaxID=3075598 RepID=A0ABU3BTY1_9BACT|nr:MULTISPECIES: thiamine-phosphate kinase [unclassified Rubrivirga]MDT0632631.1 thiamine-phosphate kinase [Rubrivirga sp. F394]MDT7855453.1 thiamine-phosphate kinase [Rubrivirga sp. S365]
MPDATPPDAAPLSDGDLQFTPVSEVGEFGLIDRLRDRLGDAASARDLVVGIGDDAAVYRVGGAGSDGSARVHVVTTDALVEGVHFDRTYVPLRALGWKAVAVNVSDVAAMNASPRFATVTLGLPNNLSVEGAEALYAGIAEACERYGLAVVGGDTTASARLVISVTVVGEADESAIVTRAGAAPGDLLCVTGDLGSAAAGLQVLLAGKDAMDTGGAAGGDGAEGAAPDLAEFAYVVERQLMPQARLDRVRQWAEAGVRPTALVDVSDGLASEAHHLSQAGTVGAVIDGGLLPIHVQTALAAQRFDARAEAYALYGGEDYELLFTLPEAEAPKLDPATYAVVGQIVEPDEGVVLRLPDGNRVPLVAGGYKHY